MSKLTAATDGSADQPGWGPGGWAWVTAKGTCGWGNDPETNHNRMELTAVLKLLETHPDRPLLIQTDSTYVLNIFTDELNGWGRKGKRTAKGTLLRNFDLIEQIDARLCGRNDIDWEWVRGHAGHLLNESAHWLAGFARLHGKLEQRRWPA